MGLSVCPHRALICTKVVRKDNNKSLFSLSCQNFKNEKSKTWISENSCIINKDLISYICSGYVSYFKGGNPNAYPYKRIIKLEHSFSPTHKEFYINALLSDAKKSQATKIEAGFERFENILLEISIGK